MEEKQKNKNISLYGKFIIFQIFLWFLFIFFSISIGFNASYINSIDNFVFNLLNIIRCKFINNFALFITFIGETLSIVILLIVIVILLKKKSLPLIYATVISVITNICLKNIIKRTRPIGQFVDNLIINYKFPTDYSFPSGHSQTGLVFFYLVVYILLENFYKGEHKKLLQNLSLLLPILIMLSRIVLGVHFFTDVLCGAILGTIIISIYLFINKMNSVKNK